MIFVTVGTHEQQFDRLVRCVDRLKAEGKITEEVMIQTGFSSYEPKACKWSKLCSYQEIIIGLTNGCDLFIGLNWARLGIFICPPIRLGCKC